MKNDLVAFYREGNFISLCKVIGKCQSSDLARHLWGKDKIQDTWRYIYFLDSPRDISVPVWGVNQAVGNADNYYYRQAEIYRNARLVEELCNDLDDDIVKALLEPDLFNI